MPSPPVAIFFSSSSSLLPLKLLLLIAFFSLLTLPSSSSPFIITHSTDHGSSNQQDGSYSEGGGAGGSTSHTGGGVGKTSPPSNHHHNFRSNSTNSSGSGSHLPYAVWRITPEQILHRGGGGVGGEGSMRPPPLSRDYRLDAGWKQPPPPQPPAHGGGVAAAAAGKRDPLPYPHHYHYYYGPGGGMSQPTATQFPPTTTQPPALRLEDIEVVGSMMEGGEELRFFANQSLAHWRTDSWDLAFGECLEMRYWLEGKRTRLLVYTCQMTRGGMCVLDLFMPSPHHSPHPPSEHQTQPHHEEHCHALKPWMFASTPFAFHIRFARRPRKFVDREQELRHLRRSRHGRAARREIGTVRLMGFKSCEDACRRVPADEPSGSGWTWDDDTSTVLTHIQKTGSNDSPLDVGDDDDDDY